MFFRSRFLNKKCHTANAAFNLHNWNARIHAVNGVSCFDCHTVHQGLDLKVRPIDTGWPCCRCHQTTQMEFSRSSHHSLNEGWVSCTNCHDPHGSSSAMLLRKQNIKATRIHCHPDKKGPFVFKYADVTVDYRNCHTLHGSINNNLLVVRQPFLCLPCHEGHQIHSPAGSVSIRNARTITPGSTVLTPPLFPARAGLRNPKSVTA